MVGLIADLAAAREAGANDERLERARALQRKAQWHLDFVCAENSMGFRASEEVAQIPAESTDCARQGQLAAPERKPVTTAGAE